MALLLVVYHNRKYLVSSANENITVFKIDSNNSSPCYFSVTLYAEFLPAKQRAKCVILLDVSMIKDES